MFSKKIGNGTLSVKVSGFNGIQLPTDDDCTRPRSYTVARAVSPRSHNSETMSKNARNTPKRTGTCNDCNERLESAPTAGRDRRTSPDSNETS